MAASLVLLSALVAAVSCTSHDAFIAGNLPAAQAQKLSQFGQVQSGHSFVLHDDHIDIIPSQRNDVAFVKPSPSPPFQQIHPRSLIAQILDPECRFCYQPQSLAAQAKHLDLPSSGLPSQQQPSRLVAVLEDGTPVELIPAVVKAFQLDQPIQQFSNFAPQQFVAQKSISQTPSTNILEDDIPTEIVPVAKTFQQTQPLAVTIVPQDLAGQFSNAAILAPASLVPLARQASIPTGRFSSFPNHYRCTFGAC